MIAIPAVDLREGACVQLVGGAYDAERVRLPDAVAAAATWARAGFGHLHVVDLDAATGRGSNSAARDAILRASRGLKVQVGGGVRDDAAIDRVLALGAARVVVGTRALEDPAWLAAAAARHPGRLVVAVDVRDAQVASHGWSCATGRDVFNVLSGLAGLPLAGVLVTAVHREGRLAGADVALMATVVACAEHPVCASGGIATMDDLRALAGCGVASAVIGMALYTGALDARAVAKEFDA